MLFITDVVKTEDLEKVNNFFTEYDNVTEEPIVEEKETCVSKYISSLVSGCYQKSVEDIENTKIGNQRTRKRSLQKSLPQRRSKLR